MNGCYIIYSQTIGKYYIGATHEDVELRICKHNDNTYGKNHFTTVANDWKLCVFIQTEDYPQAVRLERKIKAMKSKKYIENLIQYPELRIKLLNCT